MAGSRTRLVALLVAGLPVGGAIAQTALGLPGLQNAAGVRERIGETVTFVCPPTQAEAANVYGTDVYTADSPVCPAAVHAGVLEPGRSGVVTLLISNGAKSFAGSERNGVVTRRYGAWDRSYSFVKDTTPGTIAWATVWSGVPMDFTAPVAVRCPPAGTYRGVLWGSDPYPRDSSICLAAVHAGVIGIDDGGTIEVRRAPGAKDYPATTRNGVQSRRWGALDDAFTVVQAPAAVSAPVPVPASVPETLVAPPRLSKETVSAAGRSRAREAPPGTTASSTVRSRSISVAGFSAVGSDAQVGPVKPRQLTLTGFAAVGSDLVAGAVKPRAVQTSGWTLVGSAP